MVKGQVDTKGKYWAVVIVSAVLLAFYLIWPRFWAYYEDTVVQQVVKSRIFRCKNPERGDPPCIPRIVKEVMQQTSVLWVDENNFSINEDAYTGSYSISCSYETVLDYPFTETLFGLGKDETRQYSWTINSSK